MAREIFETIRTIIIIIWITEAIKEKSSEEQYFKKLIISGLCSIAAIISLFWDSISGDDIILPIVCVVIMMFDTRSSYRSYCICKEK